MLGIWYLIWHDKTFTRRQTGYEGGSVECRFDVLGQESDEAADEETSETHFEDDAQVHWIAQDLLKRKLPSSIHHDHFKMVTYLYLLRDLDIVIRFELERTFWR